jgi:hypothetical protein
VQQSLALAGLQRDQARQRRLDLCAAPFNAAANWSSEIWIEIMF